MCRADGAHEENVYRHKLAHTEVACPGDARYPQVRGAGPLLRSVLRFLSRAAEGRCGRGAPGVRRIAPEVPPCTSAIRHPLSIDGSTLSYSYHLLCIPFCHLLFSPIPLISSYWPPHPSYSLSFSMFLIISARPTPSHSTLNTSVSLILTSSITHRFTVSSPGCPPPATPPGCTRGCSQQCVSWPRTSTSLGSA